MNPTNVFKRLLNFSFGGGLRAAAAAAPPVWDSPDDFGAISRQENPHAKEVPDGWRFVGGHCGRGPR